MGKYKPTVTAIVSSRGSTLHTNTKIPALQTNQIDSLCCWLHSVFEVVFRGSYYSFAIKANLAGSTIFATDGGWSKTPFLIPRKWEEFLDLQEKLDFYTTETIRFGLQTPNATTVNLFEYAWNLLEEELQ